jgi:hypothetical protein
MWMVYALLISKKKEFMDMLWDKSVMKEQRMFLFAFLEEEEEGLIRWGRDVSIEGEFTWLGRCCYGNGLYGLWSVGKDLSCRCHGKVRVTYNAHVHLPAFSVRGTHGIGMLSKPWDAERQTRS